MTRHSVKILTCVAFALLVGAASLHAQSVPGPQGPETEQRRQLWLIPSTERNVLMRSTVFRPPGAGPFPLVVINHGSSQRLEQRADQSVPAFVTMARWFVARGYAVVVPQRPGHGETGGSYLEDQNGCEEADFHGSGLRTADSIAAAIDYMTGQPFVRKTGVVVVGTSAGGWGALALASRNPRGVAAVINFAGGRGGRVNGEAGNNCAPSRLIEAARAYGSTARIPSLWIYAENDSYFTPTLSKRMADAYRSAGGRVDYRLVPPFGAEGHLLMQASDGAAVWGPIVERFLAGKR
jgi:dienelactone hydrolase